jgi:hypothetical protein
VKLKNCEKILTFGWGKFNLNWFPNLKLIDGPVCNLQVCDLVLIEFTPSQQQTVFQIKCQKKSHLQMGIFWHFHFCQRRIRINGFWRQIQSLFIFCWTLKNFFLTMVILLLFLAVPGCWTNPSEVAGSSTSTSGNPYLYCYHQHDLWNF